MLENGLVLTTPIPAESILSESMEEHNSSPCSSSSVKAPISDNVVGEKLSTLLRPLLGWQVVGRAKDPVMISSRARKKRN